MIKKLIAIVIATSLLTSCMLAHRITETVKEPFYAGHLPNIPEVPIPRHFVVDNTTLSSFDSQEGRIAEARAQGFASVDDVKDFYDDVLSSKGWSKIGEGTYAKNGELLTITVAHGNTLTEIRYKLRPYR